MAQLVKNPPGKGYLSSIPGLWRYPGEGNGYPRQYSGLENSMAIYSPWRRKESMELQRVGHNWATFTQNPQPFPCTISWMAMWPVLGRWVRDEFSLFLPTLDPPARLQRPRHNRNTLTVQDCSLPAHQKGWIELFKRWELDAHKQAAHLLKCAAAHLSREKGRPRIVSFVIFTFWCEGPSVQVWACLEETRICRWNSNVGLLCRLSHWDFLQELGLQCWYFYSSGVCQRPAAAGGKWAHGALQQPLSTGLLSAWAPPRVPA